MSIGSVLVGIASLAIVVAYLARPFRRTAAVGLDQTIESWVTRVQREAMDSGSDVRLADQDLPAEDREGHDASAAGVSHDQAVNFCPQCGRKVATDDRFCSGCGTRLRREEA